MTFENYESLDRQTPTQHMQMSGLQPSQMPMHHMQQMPTQQMPTQMQTGAPLYPLDQAPQMFTHFGTPFQQMQHQMGVPTMSGTQLPPYFGTTSPVLSPYTGLPIGAQFTGGMLPLEQSYIENILRFNRGKMATIYMTFENNPEWPSRVFRGRIEEAGRDHIIVSSPEAGRNYLLLMVNLDYVEFDEPIAYIPQVFPGTAPQR